MSSWVQALPEASRKYGNEWERKGKAAAAVLRTSGSHGVFCPWCLCAGHGGQQDGTLGKRLSGASTSFQKNLGHLPRPRSLKGV